MITNYLVSYNSIGASKTEILSSYVYNDISKHMTMQTEMLLSIY